jgi:DUF4097 and DUF4098 domain-containing protein YvlB
MQSKTFDTGTNPKIIFESVGGKLRLRPTESQQVEIRGGDNGDLAAEQTNGSIVVRCSADCQVLAPPNASFEAETIGSDVSVLDIEGDLMFKTVGGDLRVKRAGAATVETIGGDMTARKLAGALSVDRLGGDALVDQVAGDVRLRSMGGDLRLSRVGGVVDASAGGDGRVSLSPQGESKHSVLVGGDLSCYLPDDSSAKLTMKAGGDLRLAVPVEAKDIPGGCEVELGDGAAEVELSAGGSLSLRTGGDVDEVVAVDLGEAIAARVGAEIETHMVEIEDRLSGLGDRLQTFDPDRVGRKIRGSIAKAQRKAARAQRRAARAQRRSSRREVVDLGTGEATSEPTEEERLVILRMLEQGKISVEEAESLLQALGS